MLNREQFINLETTNLLPWQQNNVRRNHSNALAFFVSTQLWKHNRPRVLACLSVMYTTNITLLHFINVLSHSSLNE